MKFSAKCSFMSRVQIRLRAASEGQRGGRRGQEGGLAPLYRANWSTELSKRIIIQGLTTAFSK